MLTNRCVPVGEYRPNPRGGNRARPGRGKTTLWATAVNMHKSMLCQLFLSSSGVMDSPPVGEIQYHGASVAGCCGWTCYVSMPDFTYRLSVSPFPESLPRLPTRQPYQCETNGGIASLGSCLPSSTYPIHVSDATDPYTCIRSLYMYFEATEPLTL